WEPSSRTCSGCGWVEAELRRSDRTFRCRHPDRPEYGLLLDRDLVRGAQSRPPRREFLWRGTTPVEGRTLHQSHAALVQRSSLAAEGLSNREIGQRLYVSHRTVGSHLYRLFPKLGITTRAELHAALAAERCSAP